MMDKDGFIFVYSLLDKSSVRQLYAFIDLLSQVCDGFDQAPPVVFIGMCVCVVGVGVGVCVVEFPRITRNETNLSYHFVMKRI